MEPDMTDPIPSAWLPAVRMDRIVLHWTAGTHRAGTADRRHYHLIVEGDGTLVRGNRSIADNVPPLRGYAAHTRGCNSHAIGVALACMGGPEVREIPFVAGRWPMTAAQFRRLAPVVAQLCRRYGIPVSPKTVLWHAEVEDTLGIPQAGKWDATVLAFDPSVRGAKACGDRIRRDVIAAMSAPSAPPTAAAKPAATAVVPRPVIAPKPVMVEAPAAAPGGRRPASPVRAIGWLSGTALAAAVAFVLGRTLGWW